MAGHASCPVHTLDDVRPSMVDVCITKVLLSLRAGHWLKRSCNDAVRFDGLDESPSSNSITTIKLINTSVALVMRIQLLNGDQRSS